MLFISVFVFYFLSSSFLFFSFWFFFVSSWMWSCFFDLFYICISLSIWPDFLSGTLLPLVLSFLLFCLNLLFFLWLLLVACVFRLCILVFSCFRFFFLISYCYVFCLCYLCPVFDPCYLHDIGLYLYTFFYFSFSCHPRLLFLRVFPVRSCYLW